MSKAVILLSGGLDSTTLMWSLRPDVKALLVNYDQRHSIELEWAKEICKVAGIECEVADLTAINHLISKGSQSGDELPPDGHYSDLTMKTTIVPNRNAIMLSIAVGWAIATGSEHVYYAAHAGDHTIYPDCRPEFFEPFREAMRAGNDWDKITLFAPFITLDKAAIVRFAAKIGVPLELTYSCYKGGEKHCGTCGTCVERREAFELAGINDPTQYLEQEPFFQPSTGLHSEPTTLPPTDAELDAQYNPQAPAKPEGE